MYKKVLPLLSPRKFLNLYFQTFYTHFWAVPFQWMALKCLPSYTVPPKIRCTSICLCSIKTVHKHMLVHRNYLIHVFRCISGLSWVGLYRHIQLRDRVDHGPLVCSKSVLVETDWTSVGNELGIGRNRLFSPPVIAI